MYYLAHAHPPSAASGALRLPAFLPTGLGACLCVVQHSSLVFRSLPSADGSSSGQSEKPPAPLAEIATAQLNARILRITALPAVSKSHGASGDAAEVVAPDQQRLAVLTDHHNPRLIILRHATPAELTADREAEHSEWNKIRTEAVLQLDELARSTAELGLGVWVEEALSASASGKLGDDVGVWKGPRVAVAHTYSGLLKVMPINSGKAPKAAIASGSGEAQGKWSKRQEDEEELMEEDDELDTGASAANGGPLGIANTACAFGVRLPHPTLVSLRFMSRTSAVAPPTIALLSISSSPSRIAGLGGQCLPVLSFHSLDLQTRELAPVPWGPPRRPPSSSDASTPRGTPRKRSSTGGSRSQRRGSSQAVPGAYEEEVDDDEDILPGSSQSMDVEEQPLQTSASSRTTQRSQAEGRNGPSAMGASVDEETARREEATLAQKPLTRAHVPLPYADALGAHEIFPLPARAGGGVLVFSETSILYVHPPQNQHSASKDRKPSTSETAGKRRKSSGTNLGLSMSPTGSSVLSTSPSANADANGKRRRSSAALATSPSQSSSVGEAMSPTSPTSNRRSSATTTRTLRTALPGPVSVVAVTLVVEPHGEAQGDADQDGIVVPSQEDHGALIRVLYATHSGSLDMLTVLLERPACSFVSATDTQRDDVWVPVGLKSQHLGNVPRPGGPTGLTYLGENFVHVASATGDSVIVRIDPSSATATVAEVDVDKGAEALAPEPSASAALSKLDVGGQLQEAARWPNLAPIIDFVVDDGAGGDIAAGGVSDGAAQARIVTCSGSGPTGSLRIVRSGVGLEDIAEIECADVRKLWTVHGRVAAGSDAARSSQLCVLGFVAHTRFLAFSDTGEIEDRSADLEIKGVETDQATLAVSSIITTGPSSARFVHITNQNVTVVDVNKGAIASWTPASAADLQVDGVAPSEIACAAANEAGQVLVAFRGGLIAHLECTSDSVTSVQATKLPHDVSCIDLTPISPSGGALGSSRAQICAVGLWNPMSVQLLSLPALAPISPPALAIETLRTLPRSVLLHTFTSGGGDEMAGSSSGPRPYLFVGLGDGTLVSYALDLSASDVQVRDKKTAALGTRPVRLERFETALGLSAVFASCDRPTVIWAEGERLTYSSVKHRDIASVAPLFLPGAPASIFLAQSNALRISTVGAIQKLDIRTLPLGHDNPLAITHHRPARAFAVVTRTFKPEGNATKYPCPSKVMLFDDTDFSLLHETKLADDEQTNAIQSIELGGQTYLVVGTGCADPDEAETSEGRLHLYEIELATGPRQSREQRVQQIRHLTQHKVPGNVFAVASVEGRLAAAVNSQVLTYELNVSGAAPALRQCGKWGCAFIACTLSSPTPGRLVVGDAMRSVVLLKVERETGVIRELARDSDPYWTTAAEQIEDGIQTFIGADIAFNLFTTQRAVLSGKARGVPADEEELDISPSGQRLSHVMNRQGAYHYGDMINKFRRGSLVPKLQASLESSAGGDSAAEPRLVFCTAAGAIAIVAYMGERLGKVVSELERNMREVLRPVGAIPHEEWRTMRTDHRTAAPAGFVDGDLVQRYATSLSPSDRARVLAGPQSEHARLSVDQDEVARIVEGLARLS